MFNYYTNLKCNNKIFIFIRNKKDKHRGNGLVEAKHSAVIGSLADAERKLTQESQL